MDAILSSVSSFGGYAIPFLVVLGIVVFVHEFGHFWVARRCGVKIETFSIGFGPEIFGWQDRHGTRWRVAWVPLGGYVKMFGDADPSSFAPDEKVAALSEDERKVAFFFQPVAKRFAVVAAGPASNYLFAALVLAGLYLFNGQPYTGTSIATVAEKSVAEQAGFLAGDIVLAIDDKPVESFEEIQRVIVLNTGTPLRFSIERGGWRTWVDVTPQVVRTKDRLGMEHARGQIGISSQKIIFRELGPLEAVREALFEIGNLTSGTLRGVWQIIVGVRSSDELGGPLRIAEMSGKVAEDGAAALIWFIVVISVNLGLINLFPIPLLDGGHLLFYVAEALRGRPLSERIQECSARAGAAVVLSLMLFATWNDLMHLRVFSYLRGLFS